MNHEERQHYEAVPVVQFGVRPIDELGHVSYVSHHNADFPPGKVALVPFAKAERVASFEAAIVNPEFCFLLPHLHAVEVARENLQFVQVVNFFTSKVRFHCALPHE